MVRDRAAKYESGSEQAFSLGPELPSTRAAPTDPRRRPPSSRSPSVRMPRTPTDPKKPINDKGKMKASRVDNELLICHTKTSNGNKLVGLMTIHVDDLKVTVRPIGSSLSFAWLSRPLSLQKLKGTWICLCEDS